MSEFLTWPTKYSSLSKYFVIGLHDFFTRYLEKLLIHIFHLNMSQTKKATLNLDVQTTSAS